MKPYELGNAALEQVNGDKTNLAPTDNATRAELAVIIRNFVQNIAEAD